VTSRCFFLVCVASAMLASTLQPRAQGGIDCNVFTKNDDGSWTAERRAFIPGANLRVEAGSMFRPGDTLLGQDIAATLNTACPNAVVRAPAAEQGPAAQPTAPGIPLSRLADANGNIDIQRLTCSHLADAPPGDTDVLLAWYSGWYNGVAKRRGINLARVRYAMRSVTDYCKANREKTLLQVMELMLK
jgi:HdeA/HdeB family